MPTNTFSVILSQDEDGYIIAECPEIPGCVSQGQTRAEAVENIRDAIRECLVVRKEVVARGTLRSLINRAGLSIEAFVAQAK